jgi:hypothetical protein
MVPLMRFRCRPTPFGKGTLVGAVALASFLVSSSPANAQSIVKNPGEHPHPIVELEPHALVGWDGIYSASGIGLGMRASFPIVRNGFIPSINNSVGVSVGADLMHYAGCYFRARCVANYLFFPVAMQWNFYFTKEWSAFAEPGVALFHGFVDDCAGAAGCVSPTTTGIRPALYLGGRYQLNSRLSLTMRVGYPAFSFGVSFM